MAENQLCAGCLRDHENNIGEGWCCECAELVCKTCSKFHKKLSPPHKVIPVGKVSTLSSSLLKPSMQCEVHHNEKKILFCCEHDQLICASCLFKFHQNCKSVLSTENAAKCVHTSTVASDLEERMDNLVRIMETILRKYSKELLNLEEQKKNIKKLVADVKQKFILHLNKLEKDFNTELEGKFNKCSDEIMKRNSDIKQRHDMLTTWKDNIKSLKEYASNVHLFHAIKLLDAETHKEETEIRKFKTDVAFPTFTFKPSMKSSNIYDILPSFGTLSLAHTLISTSSDLKIDRQGQSFMRSERQVSLVTSLETSSLGNKVSIRAGCFVPDDKLCLCDKNRKRIFLCNRDGSSTKIIDLDYDPINVALYDENTILVSLGTTGIQKIDLKSLKPGRLITVGRFCTAITCLDEKIWVKSNEYTLTKIDINGKVLNEVTTTFNPFEICLTKDGDIYCTDSRGNSVYVVRSDGEKGVVYNSRDLRWSDGITVDNFRDVYIAGRESHNIHRISSGGMQSGIILKGKDGIHIPSGLSFSHQTEELMVVNNAFKSISIYKLS